MHMQCSTRATIVSIEKTHSERDILVTQLIQRRRGLLWLDALDDPVATDNQVGAGLPRQFPRPLCGPLQSAQ